MAHSNECKMKHQVRKNIKCIKKCIIPQIAFCNVDMITALFFYLIVSDINMLAICSEKCHAVEYKCAGMNVI